MIGERREFLRLRVRLTTIVKIVKTGRAHRALTNDISGGGICFRTDEDLQVGEMLDIDVQLPDRRQPVNFTAEICWCHSTTAMQRGGEEALFEVGVHFVTIDPKERALMVQFATMNAIPNDRRQEPRT